MKLSALGFIFMYEKSTPMSAKIRFPQVRPFACQCNLLKSDLTVDRSKVQKQGRLLAITFNGTHGKSYRIRFTPQDGLETSPQYCGIKKALRGIKLFPCWCIFYATKLW